MNKWSISEDIIESLEFPLQPYDVWGNVDINKARHFFDNDEIKEQKWGVWLLFSGVDFHDIYGDTGNVEIVVLARGNTMYPQYSKYIGDLGMNADEIRDYIKKELI